MEQAIIREERFTRNAGQLQFPVSPIDGYVYSQDELEVIGEFIIARRSKEASKK